MENNLATKTQATKKTDWSHYRCACITSSVGRITYIVLAQTLNHAQSINASPAYAAQQQNVHHN